jgi:signal peptide peptidase SppA
MQRIVIVEALSRKGHQDWRLDIRSNEGRSSNIMSVGAAVAQHGVVSRLFRRAGGALKTGLALVGVAAVSGALYEYKRMFPNDDDDDKKKKVLVIPFHRLQLVEQKETSPLARVQRITDDKEDPVTAMETRELVKVLHHAASDPSIAAVYGVFGHGGTGVSEAGWATLEEVRNALRVVRESHRRHVEPNFDHQMQVIPRVQSKPLYAYTDSFASMGDPANKEYYLASIFTHIHMQQQGELNLFGMFSQQFFLKDLLTKYGIQLHVFKHGQYKNSPNVFTQRGFNKPHYENVTNVLESINESVCQDITSSRSKALLTSWLTKQHGDNLSLWKSIHQSGTFPSASAWKAGLVDYLPRRDPLTDLVESNSGVGNDEDNDHEKDAQSKKKEVITARWKVQETDFARFKAESTISLKDYAKQLSKTKDAAMRRENLHEYSLVVSVGSSFGKEGDTAAAGAPEKSKDRIALLHVDGTLNDELANKLVKNIRKIHEDKNTKAVVVRVTSPGGLIVACETIHQELKALERPLIFSFGDVSASGGYYIAAGADRIFCSPKTITGSIGVFGVRMDLRGLARKYNINVDHVASGDLSGTYMPFVPMSRKMRNNFGEQIDRYYDQFKAVVSEGRHISLEDVDRIAQGRVWTGDQAKTIGLVDELGGLHRAIAHARRNYTGNTCEDDSDVVVWPKKRSLLALFVEAEQKKKLSLAFSILCCFLSGNELSGETTQWSRKTDIPLNGSGAVDWILQSPVGIPGTLSGVLMTADENSAIRCLLEAAKAKQASSVEDSHWT